MSLAFFKCRDTPVRGFCVSRADAKRGKSFAASEPTSFALLFTAPRPACTTFGGPVVSSSEPQAAGKRSSLSRSPHRSGGSGYSKKDVQEARLRRDEWAAIVDPYHVGAFDPACAGATDTARDLLCGFAPATREPPQQNVGRGGHLDDDAGSITSARIVNDCAGQIGDSDAAGRHRLVEREGNA